MPLAWFLGGLLVVFAVVGYLVAAALLWLSARLCRVGDATYRRALLTVVVVSVINLALAISAANLPARDPTMALVQGLATIVVYLAIAIGCIKGLLRIGAGKAILVAVVWSVLQATYTAGAVFLLKSTVAEAYVIPTGGMAETLWGYHKAVSCPNCGFSFPLNASSEADPQAGWSRAVTRCECPNCRHEVDFAQEGLTPAPQNGDRVAVAKSGYGQLQRNQVVVFVYPVEPRRDHIEMNYIKRLIGLPGETIAIAQGQIYVYSAPRDLPAPDEYWGSPLGNVFSWPDDPGAQELWKQGKFEIVRKAPDVILAMRRIVYDNDFQPANKDNYPIRWTADNGWKGDEDRPRRFTVAEPADKLVWLRYRHLLRGGAKPELITDFLGYNSGDSYSGNNGTNWVGDLVLDCEVQVDKVDTNGELRLELARGVDRFQARFNLQTGECGLYRIGPKGEEKPLTDAQGQPTALKGPGKYHVRLANVDERLTLWVNDQLPFGDGSSYPAPSTPGPTAHDLQPASVGMQGAVASVTHLQLWRDTYYLRDVSGDRGESLAADERDDPAKWENLRTLAPRFFYVQPGHYLCLGDNSPASSDGRSWGMVPERLMRGPAALIYYPLSRVRQIR